MTIQLNEDLITTFTPTTAFNPSNIDFFVGTSVGKLIYFYKGWINDNKESIFVDDKQNTITSVVYFRGFVAWSTVESIRVIHYQKKQKICLIKRPAPIAHVPEYFYNSKDIKPTMIWRTQEGQDQFYVSWFNILKIGIMKESDGKF